jgi:hypothetical protein
MATVPSRAARLARSALTVPAVLIAVVVAGLLGAPAIAQAAVGAPAATAQHAATVQHAAKVQRAAAGQPATQGAASTAGDKTAPSGICSAPESATSAACASATRGPAV